MSGRDDSFLSRWARRKQAVAAEEAEARVSAEPAAAPAEAPPPETRTDAEILEELGLKDPDLLEAGDDFRAFLQAAVPEHLRRRALRKLWVSNPVLANLDGLNDYDGDFTGGSVGPGMLKTAYQVGRGLVRDLVEDGPEAEAGASAAAAATPPAPAPQGGDQVEDDPAGDEFFDRPKSGNSSGIPPHTENNAKESTVSTVSARRKIRFRY